MLILTDYTGDVDSTVGYYGSVRGAAKLMLRFSDMRKCGLGYIYAKDVFDRIHKWCVHKISDYD